MFKEIDEKYDDILATELKAFKSTPQHTKLKDFNSRFHVTSATQKAIRRGHLDIALKMGNALANSMSPYFWYRVNVWAMEDVMFGNLDAVKKTLRLATNKTLREKFGNLHCAEYILTQLTTGNKDRSACDCVVYAGASMDMADARKQLGKMTDTELCDIVLDEDMEFGYRTVAARYLSGTKAGSYVERAGKPSKVVDLYQDLNIPDEILWLVHNGYIRKAESMPAGAGLVFHEYCPSEKKLQSIAIHDATKDLANPKMFGKIPAYAYDAHVSQGKKAINLFGQNITPLKKLLKNKTSDYTAALMSMMFRSDTDFVDKRVILKDEGDLRFKAGYGHLQMQHQLDPIVFWQGVDIIQSNIELLNYYRGKVLGDLNKVKPKIV